MGKEKTGETHQSKRPFAKSDLEAVLKAATKPLKKEQSGLSYHNIHQKNLYNLPLGFSDVRLVE